MYTSAIREKLQHLKFPTSGLAFKAISNCMTSSGGDLLSISAPNIEIGTLTAEHHNKLGTYDF